MKYGLKRLPAATPHNSQFGSSIRLESVGIYPVIRWGRFGVKVLKERARRRPDRARAQRAAATFASGERVTFSSSESASWRSGRRYCSTIRHRW